ncbi:hypothetical protein AAU61_18645 [Desulfocarbo indianensis]|nr:hypothetical protein AAU61_18645 [Desulfocarbo indianensis]
MVVVDDDPVLVDFFTKALRPYYRVRGFIQPLQALNHLRRQDADILITDYTMPDLDGIELGRQVKEMRPRIKVVMISGTFSLVRGQPSQLPAEVVDRFLAKPFGLRELLDQCRLVSRSATSGE